MPSTFELSGAVKLRKILRAYLPRVLSSRKLLQIFPLVKQDRDKLVYERRQIATGLQQVRGLGGPTLPVSKPGLDTFDVLPGYYGDSYVIGENELVRQREIGDWETFENADSQMARATEHLTERWLNRAEKNVADLLTTGGFTVVNPQGVSYHQDVFNVRQYTPGTLFDDLTNSTPINYVRDLIPKIQLGLAVDFTKGFMLMSRPTLNLFLKNANAADINGKRLRYGETINGEDQLSEILTENSLPPVMVYDEVWYADPPGSNPPTTPAATRFIPNGKIVLVGRRVDGEPVGEYSLTRAAQNEKSGPGEWYQVEDRRANDPCQIIMRAGHNGGPVAYYSEAIAVINAAASNSSAFS